MFIRMILSVLLRQRRKMLMIALTIALGASLATAMLNVVMDVGDKVNQELKTYGANINVVPRGASLIGELYGVDADELSAQQYLEEKELGKLKTIFWAFNILDFAPYLELKAHLNDSDRAVPVVGVWFNRHLALPTGEEVDTGIAHLRNWWEVQGEWVDDQNVAVALNGSDAQSKKLPALHEAMLGTELAQRLGIAVGDTVSLQKNGKKLDVRVRGIFRSGSEEDRSIFTDMASAQELAGVAGKISRVEVSALTTPENDLSRRAERNPDSLSVDDWETWYCTAYVSSIAFQIEEVMTNSRAKAIRQVAESEGEILKKTQLMMLLITLLSLVGSALAISNLVTAGVIERSREIGLLKAIGASDGAVIVLILSEIVIVGILGAVLGYFVGLFLARLIGLFVFSAAISIKPMVIPLVGVLIFVVTIGGSLPAIKLLLALKPAEVLHGR